MFPRDHIQLILAAFHKVDNKNLDAPGEPGYGPFANLQPLVEHPSRILRHHDTHLPVLFIPTHSKTEGSQHICVNCGQHSHVGEPFQCTVVIL